MCRTAKPFVVEHKSRKHPNNAVLDNDMVCGDDLPSRDINADVAGLADEGQDYLYEAALRAADSLFGLPNPTERAAASDAPGEAGRTILKDLSYEDPLDARLAAAALVKRGRKPGSKNKPKLATAP